MSDFADESKVFETFIKNNWNETTDCPIQYENAPFKQPQSNVWARLNVIRATTNPAACGMMKTRTPGILIMQIFLPDNTGTRRSDELCDKLATLLNGKTFMMANGVARFETVSKKTLGLQDGFYQVNAEVAYQRDADSEDNFVVYNENTWKDFISTKINRSTHVISEGGNLIVSLPAGAFIETRRFDIESGVGVYAYNIRISGVGCINGLIVRLNLSFPASTNPTINVINDSNNNVLFSERGTGTAFKRYLELTWNSEENSWNLDID